MPTSSEELYVLETFAKFQALKELLEDDIAEENPSKSEFRNVSSNHPAFKDLYLEISVAQQKYKCRFVPSQISEADFNSSKILYKYNDTWLADVKQTFKRVNKSVINFLDNWSQPADLSKEEKINTALVEEMNRLIQKNQVRV